MKRVLAEKQVEYFQELVNIGLALSKEKDIDNLLALIVEKARKFSNAEGGTLYICNELEEVLEFAIVQNEALDLRSRGKDSIPWQSVPMRMEDGGENHANVSAHCALTGRAVNIPDVYSAEGFDFEGTKQFDDATGYRSISMLVIPMRDHENEVVGVLQLLNAHDPESNRVIPFPEHDVELITCLASQAAIALTQNRLILGLEKLLDSFVKVIAGAIDEKSPYTGGHIMRVARLAEMLAHQVSEETEGPFADVFFNEDEFAEIRLAAWMHDIGKITTPEHLVNKATKLETVYDRIESIRYRIEILKRDAEIYRLRKAMGEHRQPASRSDCGKNIPDDAELEKALAFLESVNLGRDFLQDGNIEAIKQLAQLSLKVGDRQVPLLEQDEVELLTVRRGTITIGERDIINNHVRITISMLEKLPFPKKLANVPCYAGMHHEKLDGSGYPYGLKGDEIPLQGRILAVADIFEALTAADRPYKKGMSMSTAMPILEDMAGNGQLDSDLCGLLVQSGLAASYARQYLVPFQQDAFCWKGTQYKVIRKPA